MNKRYVVRRYSSPRVKFKKTKYWVYPKVDADKEGIEYKIADKFDDISIGDKFLTEDGYVIDCIDKFEYLKSVVLVTPAGSFLEGVSKLNALPVTNKVRDIKGFKDLKLEFRTSELYDLFFEKYLETPDDSLTNIMRRAMAEYYDMSEEKIAPFYVMTKVHSLMHKDLMRGVIMRDVAENYKNTLEKVTTELNAEIIRELEAEGITPKTIAQKIKQLLDDEDSKVVLQGLRELNKIVDAYPKKVTGKAEWKSPMLHLKPHEAEKIKELSESGVNNGE